MYHNFQINRDNPKVAELKLTLHKPNGEQVGVLNDVIDRNGSFNFGRFNEMEFTMPRYVERKHERVKYKEFDIIRDKYLVTATYGDLFSEIFVVTNISNSGGDTPKKAVKLKSRQYELNGKMLYDTEALSYTVREVLDLILKNTNWSIGEIDKSLELIIDDDGFVDDPDKVIPRRSFEETKITALNFLYKVAETYEVILQFDTFNRKVNAVTPEKAEIDKGLFASYGKFIKSLDEDINAESTVTRLFVYGKDGLRINEVNPTGLSYLEDFSYYMQDYETNSKGEVVSSSPYMSDELCQAIIDYNLLLIEKEGVFESYLTELDKIQDEWTKRMSEMYQLEYDLAIIQDNLDIAKAQEHDQIDKRKKEEKDKLAEIDKKQNEVDAIDDRMQLVENDILELQDELSLESNFTAKQIVERNDYISYGEWSNENIFEVDELYEKGKEQLKKMNSPTKDLDLSLIQFLNSIECHSDWDRIGLGYVIRTDYEPLGIEFTAMITEMRIGFDNNDLSITISNVDYKDDKLKFLEMLYGTAVSTADRLKSKDKEWSDNIDRTDYLAEFLENPWETSRQRIEAGVDETVQISRRGIIITNPRFPNEKIIMQSGILALSNDYGETWSTGITGNGIFAERLIGKVILGEKLMIGDDEGTFEIVGNLLTIKDRNEVVRLRLGEYANNTFGLQLLNKTGKQVVLDENGILQTWQQGAADNVDQTHGLTMHIFLPADTLSIRQARLRFRILPFRAYSGTTEAGGASVPTTAGGGAVSTSTRAGGGSNQTSSNGGASTQTSSSGGGVSKSTASGGSYVNTTSSGGGDVRITDMSTLGSIDMVTGSAHAVDGSHVHQFIIPGSRLNHRHDISLPNHTHGMSIPSHTHNFETPNHSHTVSTPNHTHTVNIPSHTHDFTIPSHTHTVTILPHRHDIAHGIYVDTFATGVGVIINDIDRTNQLGGKFNSSQANLDVAPYLNVGQWNEITLTTERLGRIDGNIFIQALMAT